jgi:hypothetical protein
MFCMCILHRIGRGFALLRCLDPKASKAVLQFPALWLAESVREAVRRHLYKGTPDILSKQEGEQKEIAYQLEATYNFSFRNYMSESMQT